MKLLAGLLYAIVLLQTLGAAITFYRSKNGALRKILIWYFGCFSIGLAGRLLTFFGFEIHSLFLILPLFVSSTIMTIYLIKNY